MITLIVWYIVTGLIVGSLGRLVVPGRNRIGIVMTVLIGVVGSVVGGLISYTVGLQWPLSLAISIGVAAVLVYLLSAPRSSRRRRMIF